MSALILDFPTPVRRLNVDHFDHAIARIERAMEWLAANGIDVIGFGYNGRGPLVAAAASPAIHKLFSGRAQARPGNRVTLYQVDTADGVRILWEEACSV